MGMWETRNTALRRGWREQGGAALVAGVLHARERPEPERLWLDELRPAGGPEVGGAGTCPASPRPGPVIAANRGAAPPPYAPGCARVSHVTGGGEGTPAVRRNEMPVPFRLGSFCGQVGLSPGLGRGTIRGMTGQPAATPHLRDLARLRRVRDRIDREYAQPLDVEALARGVNMSAGHLSRSFRRAYGESPYSYLMTRRIERAMALLRLGHLSVTEVCFEVGCSSLGTFSTRFTELVGMPPSAYRNQAAGEAAGMPPCVAKQVTRPVRNREAPDPAPRLE
ncbi:putative AraC family transcriptional regulator [Deinococcus aerius]|uniref:Putative AraC family transcriptional regulator n=2 Tax=Deinococcus aerius TaxID=200253 RepID=A0A2I9CXI8_9DEIO|nr:putative AraC family transcriptional regulator [Deinococcus aerius]